METEVRYSKLYIGSLTDGPLKYMVLLALVKLFRINNAD